MDGHAPAAGVRGDRKSQQNQSNCLQLNGVARHGAARPRAAGDSSRADEGGKL
jgi:hypothetical protein